MQRVSTFFKGNADALEQERINKELQEKLWADPAPFRFKPGQLCSLIDPEDYEALRKMGGVNGLLAGVGSNPESGIMPDTSAKDGKYAGTVADRERVYGRNVLPERKSKSLLTLMWLALQDKILIVLIIAAIVSLALGFYTDFGQEERVPCLNPDEGETDCKAPKVDWVEGVAILVAVLIVDLVGSLNDWQKERQFRTLDAKKEARDVTVLRSGTKHQVDVHDVLVGDICDESSATGESDMISKLPYDEYTKELDSATGPLKHKSCFMISGSKVLEGVGEFAVTAVGPMSFNGKLMMSLREEPENTPLQTKLNHMAELIAKLGTTAGLVLFIALMIRYFVQLGYDKDDGTPTLDASKYGRKFIDILIISVTIIVVATMANATCVCTDKTGTLTQNKMNVVAGCIGCDLHFQDRIKFEVDNSAPSDDLVVMEDMSSQLPTSVRKLLTDSICINSTAFIPDRSDPVEEEEKPVEKPWYVKLFSSSPKKMQVAESESPFIGSKTETALLTMVINLNWGDYASIRKATQVVQMIPFGSKRKSMGVVIKTDHGYLALHKQAAEGEIPTLPIDDALRTNLEDTIKGYASQSLRTISLCYRDFESWPPPNAPTEEGEVKYEFLAQEMTLLGITAIEDPLRQGVPEAVRACGRAGVQVKMCTGDNILTARSIANQCGIFKPGSEVAKEASDIILLDDNFSSIVNAIMWGRCVNDAVRKFLQFQFTVNIVAVIVTFVSAIASDSENSVLTAVQLLWLNLIMDTLAALALATDPADESSLDRNPDRSSAPLVTTEMWKHIVVQSIYQIIVILVLNFEDNYSDWNEPTVGRLAKELGAYSRIQDNPYLSQLKGGYTT
ncbi:P-type Ca(2+) transporter [Malassezia japonica]|uniref:P-type Ca(2+) transporter n=1 Tax=Malassezia japonica TaxID=223818 RepID=A0AAF0F3V1_9BASI|nr:P-type Ca(2+) transporter [Malassezia japonica]WFD39356.1 P-type Ca(2+) transporter [Malassezia japonica]